MAEIAIRRPGIMRTFGMLVTLTVLFLAILFASAWHSTRTAVEPVPLKPCKKCTDGCPCPRLSGEIRCGCP